MRRYPYERYPNLPLSVLWGDRLIRSVANLTRRDGEEFLALARRLRIRTTVETLPLGRANEALACLRDGQVRGRLCW